jgi:hypothetical protein
VGSGAVGWRDIIGAVVTRQNVLMVKTIENRQLSGKKLFLT